MKHSVILDDCLFHELAQLDSFDVDRTLSLPSPPDGEFALMNYRSTRTDFTPPFRLAYDVQLTAPTRLEVTLTLSADFPKDKSASGLSVKVPLPKTAGRPVCTLGKYARALGEKTDFSEKDKVMTWTFHKLPGQTEHVLHVSVPLLQPGTPAVRRDVGPISLQFIIPMWTPSKLQVRYLQILKGGKDYNPYR
jgi:AP-4 complex subunit mu-1